jgi:hypothetical protein
LEMDSQQAAGGELRAEHSRQLPVDW